MNTTHDTCTIELTFSVDVVFRKERYIDKDDADGNRGVVVEEYIPERAEVQEQVPPEVEAWLKTAAIEQFERQY